MKFVVAFDLQRVIRVLVHGCWSTRFFLHNQQFLWGTSLSLRSERPCYGWGG